MPPATMHCASPALIAWAASITALSPEPQTLLTVSAGSCSGFRLPRSTFKLTDRGRESPRPNLLLHLLHELRERENDLFVPLPPRAHRDRPGFGFALPHHGHVGHLVRLAVAHLVVERLAALVHVRADAGGGEPLLHRACRGELGIRDREHPHLLGREP